MKLKFKWSCLKFLCKVLRWIFFSVKDVNDFWIVSEEYKSSTAEYEKMKRRGVAFLLKSSFTSPLTFEKAEHRLRDRNTFSQVRFKSANTTWQVIEYWTRQLNEGTAANRRRSGLEGHRIETRCQQGLFSGESLLKCTLPLVILYTQYQFMCEMYWLTVQLLYTLEM